MNKPISGHNLNYHEVHKTHFLFKSELASFERNVRRTALSTPTYNIVSQETVKPFPETSPKETLDDGAAVKSDPPGGKTQNVKKRDKPILLRLH